MRFMGYYEIQLPGQTVYLHRVFEAKDLKTASRLFFKPDYLHFRDPSLRGIRINPKGLSRWSSKCFKLLAELGLEHEGIEEHK